MKKGDKLFNKVQSEQIGNPKPQKQTETRVYFIDPYLCANGRDCKYNTDTDFSLLLDEEVMEEAEIQGNVMTLDVFQDLLNGNHTQDFTSDCYYRFIERPFNP